MCFAVTSFVVLVGEHPLPSAPCQLSAVLAVASVSVISA